VPSRKPSPSAFLPTLQEVSVYTLILGTLALVSMTGGLSLPTLALAIAVLLARALGLKLSTTMGCVLLGLLAACAPIYWFFLRPLIHFDIKDFLLAVLLIFLLSAQTGRDFAAVSSYCVWIMMASLFPSSGPQQWFLLAALFTWFLVVQSLNELRRNREMLDIWKGKDGWALIRPFAGLATLIVLGVGLLSLGLYTLLPRNPIAAFQIHFQPFRRLIGFSNSVRLGEIGALQEDRTPAFRVRFLQGTPPSVLRWRGAALGDFNGFAWNNLIDGWNELPSTGKLIVASDEQRRRPGQRLYYEFHTLASMDRVIFTLGVPEYVYLPEGRLRINAEGAFRQVSLETSLPAYSLSGWIDPAYHAVISDSTASLPAELRRRYTKLPYIHPRILDFARELTGPSPDPMQAAQRVEAHLRERYGYSLNSRIRGRDPLYTFLFTAREGHCEYFASAMAVMLRSLKIPTRVVTGFYHALPEPIDGWYVIRAASAHSWVEVWIDGKGWTTFDPTPGSRGEPRFSAIAAWFQRMQDRFLVLSEDFMGGASGFTRPALPKVEFQPIWLWPIGLMAALALAYKLWPGQRPKPHAATKLYETYLAETKRKREPHQTARDLKLPPAVQQAYEQARFSPDPAALRTLQAAIAQHPVKP
jgi:protein-glutamine gamma-glutamyltransferase